MTFAKLVRKELLNCDFSGRSTRRDWWAATIGVIALAVASQFMLMPFSESPDVFFTFVVILGIYQTVIIFASGVRRLHDLDKPSWVSSVPPAILVVGILSGSGPLIDILRDNLRDNVMDRVHEVSGASAPRIRANEVDMDALVNRVVRDLAIQRVAGRVEAFMLVEHMYDDLPAVIRETRGALATRVSEMGSPGLKTRTDALDLRRMVPVAIVKLEEEIEALPPGSAWPPPVTTREQAADVIPVKSLEQQIIDAYVAQGIDYVSVGIILFGFASQLVLVTMMAFFRGTAGENSFGADPTGRKGGLVESETDRLDRFERAKRIDAEWRKRQLGQM